MMNSHKHTIVFSHGDLRPPNIIVRDGHVAAILDWELGGWYPEYWEFAKAFQVEHFITDWPTYILDILKPYYGEQAMHSYLTTVLW
jgi:aminoglycoside phosphotransferase (APT) family kinase protein